MSEESAPELTPTGAAATRLAIAEAAGRLFLRHGYAGTSVRAVAAAAGADPALVIRYFGSKEELFLETVPLVGHYEYVTAGPLEGLGRRLVESLFRETRDLQFGMYRAMMRASDSKLVRDRLVAAAEAMFVVPLAPRLAGGHARMRARLVGAQFAGLLDVLAILDDDEFLDGDVEVLVRLYGGAIQSLIDGPPAGPDEVP